MVYIHCITVEEMKELDLFDDIPYKYIKDIIDNDNEEIDIDIEDIECDKVGLFLIRFKFQIVLPKGIHYCDDCGGNKNLKVDLVKEYNYNSHYSHLINGLHHHVEEGEEEDYKSSTDDESSTDEEEEEEEEEKILRVW